MCVRMFIKICGKILLKISNFFIAMKMKKSSFLSPRFSFSLCFLQSVQSLLIDASLPSHSFGVSLMFALLSKNYKWILWKLGKYFPTNQPSIALSFFFLVFCCSVPYPGEWGTKRYSMIWKYYIKGIKRLTFPFYFHLNHATRYVI